MKLSIFILAGFLMFVFAGNAEAKVLPQAKKSGQKIVAKVGPTIGVSPRFRHDRKALLVNFSSLQNAKSVSYLLTYKSYGQQEGARGDLNLSSGANQTQELLFGTCSKNVCRYHSGIKDARFEVTYTLKSGKKYIKRFKVRI